MKKILITQENSGQRIDIFLREGIFLNEEITRGEIIRKIKNGEILLNGKIAKPSCALKAGDEIKINIQKEKTEVVPNKNIKLEIIYRDENLIIVNKPAGLQVHPSDTEKENTLVNALILAFPEIKTVTDSSEGSWMRPGIVHRLDKDTSGVMVVARNKKTFAELKRKFQNREIEKNYVAVVYGHLKKTAGVVNEPIARSSSFKKQKIARGKMKGVSRSAVTEYNLLKRYGNFDFVEVFPKTGRMHQIRVHLAFLGNPIVGDGKYTRKDLAKPAGITRQLLHAQKISFELGGKKYCFSAKLPADMSAFLENLVSTPTRKK